MKCFVRICFEAGIYLRMNGPIETNTLTRFCLLVALVCLALGASAQTSLTNGLIAHFPFLGNANDHSGYANHGTPINALLTADRFNDPNSAYALNGSNARITAPNQAYLTFPNGEFSISTWAAFASMPDPVMFLVGMDNGRGDHPKWILAYGQLALPAPPGYSDNYVYFATTGGFGSGMGYFLASTRHEPELGSWHHYLFTKAGTDYTLYIDGFVATGATNYMNDHDVLRAGITGPAAIVSGITAPLTIGEAEGGGFVNGKLDDIRIYSRALSPSEVQQLYLIEGLCTPRRATATAEEINGFVVGATITDPGCGYTNPPTVLIRGGGGTGAAATAVVSNGKIVAINITNAGAGYTEAPRIIVASPPFLPTVSITVSKVKVTQLVLLGRKYLLESSADLVNWVAAGPEFVAETETMVNEFDVETTGRFFRLREVP